MKYYPDMIAVIDEEFAERADRLSIALHMPASARRTMLEAFYGICQERSWFRLITESLSGYGVYPKSQRFQDAHREELTAPIKEIEDRLSSVQFVAVKVDGAEQGLPAANDEEFIGDIPEDAKVPEVEINENRLLTLNYTSGTSSRPKGVMLTHRSN